MEMDAAPAVLDLLVVGLGPGGCAAALAAHLQGLRTLAVEARGPEATRSRLVLVRPGAQDVLRRIGLPGVTHGRRASTIRHIEGSLREALTSRAAASDTLSLCWHTRVTALEQTPDHVRVSLFDATCGQPRTVHARHVIDASGGRLEPLGRPERERRGPQHIVATAEYETPPWFDGIAGVRDPASGEALVLVPMRGRTSITAYLDAPPGRATDPAALVQRFEAVTQRLAMGTPREPVLAVDVVQRLLRQPCSDRVLPIGDSVGTVDLWLGAGMSTAIEDAFDAAQGLAIAQGLAPAARELAHTRRTGAGILARHRARKRQGQWMLALRPLLVRLWPAVPLHTVQREAVGCPRLLWPAMRLVVGRRPQAAGAKAAD